LNHGNAFFATVSEIQILHMKAHTQPINPMSVSLKT